MQNMMVGKLKLLEISKEAQVYSFRSQTWASLLFIIAEALKFHIGNDIIHITTHRRTMIPVTRHISINFSAYSSGIRYQ